MIAFILNNLATLIISAVLLTVIVLIFRYLIKKKKDGKSVGCGCGCGSCPSASMCHKH